MNNLAIKEKAEQNSNLMIFNPENMGQMSNLAELMAQGRATVPKHLQNAPADCMAIVMQAVQWGMNPYAVAQKTHLVGGTLGYEAQLVNSVISSSNAIDGRFQYEYGGDWAVSGEGVGQVSAAQKGVNVNAGTTISANSWVRCGAVIAGESEITWGEPLYPANVTTKNSPLWKTVPKQQAAYLALKYWARLYTPDVIMGVYTKDELLESNQAPKERDITPAPAQSKSSTLNSIINEVEAETIVESDAPGVDDDGVESTELTMNRYLEQLDGAETLQVLKLTFADAWRWAKDHQLPAVQDEFKATYDARLLEF